MIKNAIISYARSLGFARVGVTSAEPLREAEAVLASWVEEGRAGGMDYLSREPGRRTRPQDLLPGAKSVIALVVSYYFPHEVPSLLMGEGWDGGGHPPPVSSPTRGEDSKEGRIARYAWGKEYHKLIGKRLESLVRYIEAVAPGARCKTALDTSPLLERAVARRAGLGFVGKNTMLITRGLGSWVFLANVITTLELQADAPDNRSCGSCRLCVDACPTGAITEPYKLDARKCIAYLTIESDEAIPEGLAGETGEWLFGCDICQDVCPHNTRIPTSPVAEFSPENGVGPQVPLEKVLSMRTEEEFKDVFGGTPLARAGRHGLLRNACLVAGQLARKDLLPQIETLMQNDPHPVVREQARRAVKKLQ